MSVIVKLQKLVELLDESIVYVCVREGDIDKEMYVASPCTKLSGDQIEVYNVLEKTNVTLQVNSIKKFYNAYKNTASQVDAIYRSYNCLFNDREDLQAYKKYFFNSHVDCVSMSVIFSFRDTYSPGFDVPESFFTTLGIDLYDIMICILFKYSHVELIYQDLYTHNAENILKNHVEELSNKVSCNFDTLRKAEFKQTVDHYISNIDQIYIYNDPKSLYTEAWPSFVPNIIEEALSVSFLT